METPAMVGDHLFPHLLARVTAVGTRTVRGLRTKSGPGQGLEAIEQQVGDSVSAKSAASP